MNGRYYYDSSQKVIENMNPDALYIGLCLLAVLVFISAVCTYEWWSMQLFMWQERRRYKKALKRRKGVIKSFIVEIEGKDMTRNKFGLLTKDVNSIMDGKLIKSVGTNGKKLDANNIIGITTLKSINCHFFVIWYREV